MAQSQSQQGQGNQKQGGMDATGKRQGEAGYDPTTDPASPQYDEAKANQARQGR